MKRAALFLLGFAAALLAQTLFASAAFGALALAYGLGLYALFFAKSTDSAWSYYVGLAVGAELLGSQRLGLQALYAYAGNLLFIIFRQQLRFTSLEGRFALALLLSLVAYGLIFSGGGLPWTGWLGLLGIFLLLGGGALLRPVFSHEPTYEPI